MRVVIITATAALGGLLFGYDTGVISGALLFLGKAFHLSHLMLGMVTSIALAGAAAGAAVAGLLADCLGRRPVLLLTAVVFVLGTALSGLASNLPLLLADRARRAVWADLRTVRYGAGKTLHGIKPIRAFSNSRPVHHLTRTLRHIVITSLGREFATASTLFTRRNVTVILG